MYLYAEENLKNELEQQNVLKTQKEEELKEVCDKLNDITSYDVLDNNQFNNVTLAILSIVLGGLFSGFGVLDLIKSLIVVADTGMKLIFIVAVSSGAFCLYMGKYYIKKAYENRKERKKLKQKGVKVLKKQEDNLYFQKVELEKDYNNVLERIDKLVKVLEHINFYRETMGIPFYQADTQQEYEEMKANTEVSVKQAEMENDVLNLVHIKK